MSVTLEKTTKKTGSFQSPLYALDSPACTHIIISFSVHAWLFSEPPHYKRFPFHTVHIPPKINWCELVRQTGKSLTHFIVYRLCLTVGSRVSPS